MTTWNQDPDPSSSFSPIVPPADAFTEEVRKIVLLDESFEGGVYQPGVSWSSDWPTPSTPLENFRNYDGTWAHFWQVLYASFGPTSRRETLNYSGTFSQWEQFNYITLIFAVAADTFWSDLRVQRLVDPGFGVLGNWGGPLVPPLELQYDWRVHIAQKQLVGPDIRFGIRFSHAFNTYGGANGWLDSVKLIATDTAWDPIADPGSIWSP